MTTTQQPQRARRPTLFRPALKIKDPANVEWQVEYRIAPWRRLIQPIAIVWWAPRRYSEVTPKRPAPPPPDKGDTPASRKDDEATKEPKEESSDDLKSILVAIPVAALVLIGAQLGLARAALAYVLEKAPQRAIAYTSFKRQTDSVAFQIQVAKAAMKIETAHLHAYRAADDIDQAAFRGEYLDYKTRARVRADTGYVAQYASDAINLLMTAHGAGSFAESSPMQRIWRDSNTAARHAIVHQPVAEEIYGKALLGAENTVTPLV